ncbi:DNA-3-methyladenine glycosylase II [Heyndrickxia sporothermodurans]|uniref:DNA-3-methyladenine glycosylase II n=1 Tax=Heyndrickxia sporothermodurans TaxID=46224 RepID=A0A150LGL3_9BACI|nr:DNA-3-methyladenine glycosylase [Heyndrickxia sporothermodurans]KYD11523.1 DNA-3-methyladenine glycosylase II [Heyndrickxia sporothermodurans]
MWEETVNISGPYDFDLALQRQSIDPLNDVHIESRTINIPVYESEAEVVSIQAIGTTDKPCFLIKGKNEQTKAHVIEQVYKIFQWNVTLDEINNHFQQTTLNEIFMKHRGTPIILDFSPYNCLVKCIIHQQLNMKFAMALTENFVHTYGFEQDGVWFYPSPDKVAEIEIEELRSMKFSQRKAEYLIGLSKLIASGELNLQELATKSDEEVTKTLVKIRGIGPWTAQNFLMFGLGRPNLFPLADIGIQNAIKKLFNLEKKPTYEEMENFSQDWHPYLSYASLYLWRSIETAE